MQPSAKPSGQPSGQPSVAPTNAFQTALSIASSTSLENVNLADFNDESVQQSFKTALARTINLDEYSGEVVANDVNITKFVEVSATSFNLWLTSLTKPTKIKK